jgi:hypothetical protein
MSANAQVTQATPTKPTSMIQRALQTDGVVSTLTGLIFTFGAGILSPIVGVEQPEIVLIFGLLIVLYGVGVFTLSNRTPLPSLMPVTIIVGNVIFVALCIGLLVADPFTFTTEGKWILLILADAVALLAIWQFIGVRRMR